MHEDNIHAMPFKAWFWWKIEPFFCQKLYLNLLANNLTRKQRLSPRSRSTPHKQRFLILLERGKVTMIYQIFYVEILIFIMLYESIFNGGQNIYCHLSSHKRDTALTIICYVNNWKIVLCFCFHRMYILVKFLFLKIFLSLFIYYALFNSF